MYMYMHVLQALYKHKVSGIQYKVIKYMYMHVLQSLYKHKVSGIQYKVSFMFPNFAFKEFY